MFTVSMSYESFLHTKQKYAPSNVNPLPRALMNGYHFLRVDAILYQHLQDVRADCVQTRKNRNNIHTVCKHLCAIKSLDNSTENSVF